MGREIYISLSRDWTDIADRANAEAQAHRPIWVWADRGATTAILLPCARACVRMPFDFHPRSFADEFGEHAVCIIHWGTATDGIRLRQVH